MTSETRLDELHAAFSSTARARRDGLTTVFQHASTGQPVGGRAVILTSEPVLDPHDVERLLAHDWRARREVTQPKGDVIRASLKIKGLPPWVDVDAVMSALEGDPVDGELQSSPLAQLGELWGEGESYGGAVLIAVADDGQPSSEPLDKARLQEVKAWEVLDRWSIHPYRSGGLAAPVDYWIITGESRLTADLLTSSSQIVHPSRVIVHTGMWMPRRWRLRHDGWGLSRLEVLVDQRQNASLGNASIGRMAKRATQDVVYVAELTELIEDQGDAYVGKRIKTMNQGLNMCEVLLLDGGIDGGEGSEPGRFSDKFETMARPLGGAADISEAQHIDWRRGSGMPQVVADGEVSAGGLNSGAEAGPWKAWAGKIEAEQKASLTRWVNWQLGLIFASKLGPTGGRVPETWEIDWISIAEPDPEFEARVGLIEAQTDRIYSPNDVGTLTGEEIKQHRNVEGKRGTVRTETADVLPPPEPAAGGALGGGRGKQHLVPGAKVQDDRFEDPKACVVIVPPDNLAKLFPHQPDRPDPHVTLLFIGPTPWDQVNTARETVARAAEGLLPIKARFTGLGYFDRDDGSRVAWVGVEFEPELALFHETLRSSLMADGVMVQHPGRPYVAHATLDIAVPAGEDYTGPVPTGEWTVSRIEVWHGDAG